METTVAFKRDSWRAKMMAGMKEEVKAGMRYGVMYKIDCATWDKMYIGETGRSIEKGLKEHRTPAKMEILNFPQ